MRGAGRWRLYGPLTCMGALRSDERASANRTEALYGVGVHRVQLYGKLPSSLICSGYMYLYIACMIFNRLMSAMSIDGIWQNNLIYFEIRRNAASHFGVRISYPCWLTAFSHSSSYTHWPATVGSFPVLVLSLVLYSYSPCLQSEQLVL